MFKIDGLRRLSISTALSIFFMKLVPIIEYNLSAIWRHLTASNLHRIDFLLFTFLKHICGVARSSRNRLILLICDTPTLVNALKQRHNLPSTEAFTSYIDTLTAKMQSIPCEFYDTPAMTQQKWRSAMNNDRHVVTRHAMHGFHFKLCTNRAFHEATDECECSLCGGHASQYHLLQCSSRQHFLHYIADNE